MKEIGRKIECKELLIAVEVGSWSGFVLEFVVVIVYVFEALFVGVFGIENVVVTVTVIGTVVVVVVIVVGDVIVAFESVEEVSEVVGVVVVAVVPEVPADFEVVLAVEIAVAIELE